MPEQRSGRAYEQSAHAKAEDQAFELIGLDRRGYEDVGLPHQIDVVKRRSDNRNRNVGPRLDKGLRQRSQKRMLLGTGSNRQKSDLAAATLPARSLHHA